MTTVLLIVIAASASVFSSISLYTIFYTRKQNIQYSDLELADLTGEVFSYLGISPKENPLYTQLFMGDYVCYLNARHSSNVLKRDILGRHGFHKLSHNFIYQTTHELRAAYVLYEISSRQEQFTAASVNSASKIFGSNSVVNSPRLNSRFRNYQSRQSQENTLQGMFKEGDSRILLQRAEILNNINRLVPDKFSPNFIIETM